MARMFLFENLIWDMTSQLLMLSRLKALEIIRVRRVRAICKYVGSCSAEANEQNV
jgi:hypothetical protein